MSNISSIIDAGSGDAQGETGTTVQTFIISLSTGAALFLLQTIIFLLLKPSAQFKRIFQPRTYLVPERNRSDSSPNNVVRWIQTVFETKDQSIIDKCGLDAYFFLRYLRMCVKIFAPLALIILPILLPLNQIGGKGNGVIAGQKFNVTGLDTLAWSNVSPKSTNRYWAHLVLALVVIGWVLYTFYNELVHYITKRQQFLTTAEHRLKASATTVLVTSIPNDLCSEEKLDELYDVFPGGLRRISLNRDYTSLADKITYRDKLVNHLEQAETNLIRNANQDYQAQQKKRRSENPEKPKKPALKREEDESPLADGAPIDSTTNKYALKVKTTSNSSNNQHSDSKNEQEKAGPPQEAAIHNDDLQNDLNSDALWAKYVSPKARDTMRILRGGFTFWSCMPAWTLIGIPFTRKVDRIYFCRREMARLNKVIEKEQQELADHFPVMNSAFIQFNNQIAAHMACQSVSHHLPKRMANRMIEISPGDVIWDNLAVSWWGRYIRYGIFVLVFTMLLFLFGVVSFSTGIISKLSTLSGSTSWLAWTGTLPSWLLSFIQGTLPPIILQATLSGLLPIIMRILIRLLNGDPTGTAVERSLQAWYFVFLFITLYIVPTISSGLTSVVTELIHRPTSIPNILATNLPTAANYYFSYIVLQSLSLSATALLQLVRMLMVYIINPMTANSARDQFTSGTTMARHRWGSFFPWYTVFAVIGLVYSIIAPLMLVFILIPYCLFWIVYRNNNIYIIRNTVDSGGLFFPRAINQLFTGLYFMEICLIGLFFLVRDVQGDVVCFAQAIIMIVAVIFTASYQYWLSISFGPLYEYLPVTLEDDAVLRDMELMERLQTNISESDPQDDAFSSSIRKAELDGEKAIKLSELQQPVRQPSDSQIAKQDFLSPVVANAPEVRRGSNVSRSSIGPPQVREFADQKAHDLDTSRQILSRLRRSRIGNRSDGLADSLHRTNTASTTNSSTKHPTDAEGVPQRQRLDAIFARIIGGDKNAKLEDLEPDQRDALIQVAFMHPALRQGRPSVWLPQDEAGVSDDEIARIAAFSDDVDADNRGAWLDLKENVEIDRQPPDLSEFWLVMPEL